MAERIKRKKTTLRRPDVRLFACSFSQFPFAPLFCVSPVRNKIRHALDIWEKRRKKNNIELRDFKMYFGVFFALSRFVHFHYVVNSMKWPIANKITHHKDGKKTSRICFIECTVYTVQPVNDLNYWMD